MTLVYRAHRPAVLNVSDTGRRIRPGTGLTFRRSSPFTGQQTRTRRTAMTATHTTVDSPIGELTLVADEGRLTGVYFPHHWYRPDPDTFGPRTDDRVRRRQAPAGRVLRGRPGPASTCPLEARGDEFQRRVWDLIARHPLRRDRHLRRPGPRARRAGHGQGRRRGRRAQPAERDRALPPRGRQGRQAHRLRRRAGPQEVPARPGGGTREAVLMKPHLRRPQDSMRTSPSAAPGLS